jgi:hypothetical protein
MALPSVSRRLGFACLAALALCGCRQDPPPTLDGSTIHVPSSAAPEPPRFAVTAVAHCKDRQVVTLRWNAALVADGPLDLRVDNPRRPLFATVASAGAKDTGAWAHRGMAFIAVAPDGTTVARAVVEGPDGCD